MMTEGGGTGVAVAVPLGVTVGVKVAVSNRMMVTGAGAPGAVGLLPHPAQNRTIVKESGAKRNKGLFFKRPSKMDGQN